MSQTSKIATILTGLLVILGVGTQTVYAASYTPAQVAAHNTQSDCWVSIDGKVYNLSTFISQHSGGQSAIIGVCGKDGTSAFNSGPHTGTTINALATFLLGDLSATVTSVTPPPPSVTEIIPDSTTVTTSGSINEENTDVHENDNDGGDDLITEDSRTTPHLGNSKDTENDTEADTDFEHAKHAHQTSLVNREARDGDD